MNLILRARRAVCCESGRDGPSTITVVDGRIAEVVDRWLESATDRDDCRLVDVEDGVLTPGLVDLHAHTDKSKQSRFGFGVLPDRDFLSAGVTTVGSQGDVGATGIEAYHQLTIAPSRTRVRLAINLSSEGETDPKGAFVAPQNADIGACVAAIEEYRDFIWAIAVNLSHHSCPTEPHGVLSKALDVATQTGLALLVGLRSPKDWALRDQLDQLRPGDVVTYCFRRKPHCFVDFESRRVLPEVLQARERGILFDVGHGRESFDFQVAEIAVAAGFLPDTISSDFQMGHLRDHWRHGLLQTMAKLQAAGMSWKAALTAVTNRPARLLTTAADRDAPFGQLTKGSCADLVVLSSPPTTTKLYDASGECREGPLRHVALVIRDGVAVTG